MLVFVAGGKPENPEKNPRSKARTNNKLSPHMAPGRNRALAALVGGERSHHCVIPPPDDLQKLSVSEGFIVLSPFRFLSNIPNTLNIVEHLCLR